MHFLDEDAYRFALANSSTKRVANFVEATLPPPFWVVAERQFGFSPAEQRDGSYRDIARHVRTVVPLVAACYQMFAIDAVNLDYRDLDGLVQEVRDAVATGFLATACIHPSQVQVVRDGYRPSGYETDWAIAVLRAAAENDGVFALDGRMIDGPVLRQADAVLARAGIADAIDETGVWI